MDNLENIVESILLVAGEPVSRTDICSKLDVDNKELKKAIEKLKEKYDETSGILLLEFGDKLQFSTNKKYANEVSLVLNPIRERALSKAAMETLSIVAYKQPVTRLDIEDIRGVNSDYTINLLLENNLIEIVGRKDALGKPLLFGTTDEFLRKFDLTSTEELPSYAELLERLNTVETKRNDDRLFNFENMPKTDAPKQEMTEKEIKEEFKDTEIIEGEDDSDDDFI